MTVLSPPWRVALTGGIACGKTAIARAFAALGVAVVDADVIARELTAPGTPLIAAIARAFGTQFLRADGTLDRRRLRARVFADAGARRQLDALLHPAVCARLETECDTARGPYVLAVVPLLFELGLDARMARVLVTDAPVSVQMTRLRARDGCSDAVARAMIAAQCPRATRRARADDLIESERHPLSDLPRIVLKLHLKYQKLAGSR